MLTIYGKRSRFCDGVSRRNFIKIGALGLGGLALPQILQAEAKAGIRKSHKAIIMIILCADQGPNDRKAVRHSRQPRQMFADLNAGNFG